MGHLITQNYSLDLIFHYHLLSIRRSKRLPNVELSGLWGGAQRTLSKRQTPWAKRIGKVILNYSFF